jgi:hypothetical protein
MCGQGQADLLKGVDKRAEDGHVLMSLARSLLYSLQGWRPVDGFSSSSREALNYEAAAYVVAANAAGCCYHLTFMPFASHCFNNDQRSQHPFILYA